MTRVAQTLNVRVPSVPHLVHIETTYACNQRCLFCYNPYRETKTDPELVDRIVRVVYESWIPHVYLIGGEPTLLGAKRLNAYIELLSERSSVTIVTNGQLYLDTLSDKLACIGVPIHGDETTHDFLADNKGSFKRAIWSAERYVARGFDVRCIPVLTAFNYDQMYKVIQLAKEIGMESVFVDRFEDGGLGSQKSALLRPTLAQFKIALGQMIAARDDFKLPVGWGTAIPFCLDDRMVACNMTCNCGAGVTFAAVNPRGDLRVCNQSERVYGNVFTEPIEAIWKKPELSEFRDFLWLSDACFSCAAIEHCTGGCKVDVNYSDTFCVDYAVRGQEQPFVAIEKAPEPIAPVPVGYRRLTPNKYTRLNTAHAETYLVTRYQTIELDREGATIVEQILHGVGDERKLIELNSDTIEKEEVRRFVSTLAMVDAIDVAEEEI